MPATGKAADDGLVTDAIAKLNASLGGKVRAVTVNVAGDGLTITAGDGTTADVKLPEAAASYTETSSGSGLYVITTSAAASYTETSSGSGLYVMA